jgi:predicted metal-binding protein
MLPPTHGLICVVAWDICKATSIKPKSPLLEANKILHEAKIQSNVTIKIQSIPINDLRFVAFSDASFASAKTLDSHQGMIIMASHKSIGENQNCSVNPIIWHSKKIQRVVVSTLSAEAMSLAGAVDILSWTRLYWAWLRDGNFKWQMADEEMLKLPPAFAAIPPTDDQKSTTTPLPVQDILKKLNPKAQSIITTDCKSLYDLISRHAPPSCQEFRTLLQAKLIKEHINNGIQIRWVPSQAQLADALTKIMDPSVLRECLSIGRYSLHDEAQILRERSDSRARLQWLRNMTHGSRGEQASE